MLLPLREGTPGPPRSGFLGDLAPIDRLRRFEDRLGWRSGLSQDDPRGRSGKMPTVGIATASQLCRLLPTGAEILYPGRLQLFDTTITVVRLQGGVPIVAVVLHSLSYKR